MRQLFTVFVATLATGLACAQPAPPSAPAADPGPGQPLAPAAPTTANATVCCSAPASTVVALEILDTLNSSRHRRGDAFALRVAEAVVVDGTVVIPVGTTGRGEVVHAAAARGGGAPGELLIAARTLDLDGRSIPLRGLKLGVTGGDNSGMAIGVSLAAGPFALFIRGHEIEIPAGTRVTAKLAQDVPATPVPQIDASAPAPVEPTLQPPAAP